MSFKKLLMPLFYTAMVAIVGLNVYFLLNLTNSECNTPACQKVGEMFRQRDSTVRVLLSKDLQANRRDLQMNDDDIMLLGAEAVKNHQAIVIYVDSIIRYVFATKNKIISLSGGLNNKGDIKHILDDKTALRVLFKNHAADTLNQMINGFMPVFKAASVDANQILDSLKPHDKWQYIWDKNTIKNANIVAVCNKLLDCCVALKNIQAMETAMFLNKKAMQASEAKDNLQEALDQIEVK